MVLIEILETRFINGRWGRFAKFLCPNTICNKIVERRIEDGKRQKSCGCLLLGKLNLNYKHGYKNTKLYRVWCDMKQRILNPKNKGYKDYGGRGIKICDEWLEFIPFRDWALSNGYKEDLQINRIFNDDNYEPSNCEFITHTENSRSRRGQKIKNMEIANEIRDLNKTGKYTQKELAEKYGVHRRTISLIINNKIWKK